MVQRVMERAARAQRLAEVVVATDDARIKQHVENVLLNDVGAVITQCAHRRKALFEAGITRHQIGDQRSAVLALRPCEGGVNSFPAHNQLSVFSIAHAS